MKATLEVMEQKEFDDWAKEQSTNSLKAAQAVAAPAAPVAH